MARTAPAGGTAVLVWTAPTSGTYFLRLAFISATGSSTGNYHIVTGTVAHGTEPGRDQRDIIVRYSDDGGATWSGPKRVNSEAALFDDFLPEIGVTTEGYPYCVWLDWRDALASCGGQSHVYVSRSRDGGDTWQANERVTTAPTAWTTALTNIAPNEGDYLGLYAGPALALGWGDARAGEADVNVWSTTVGLAYTLGCASDTTVHAGTTLSVGVPLTNSSPIYPNTYDYTVTVDRAWGVTSPSGSVTVSENGAIGSVPVTITIPDTARGTAHVCVATSESGTQPRQCCFAVTATTPARVGDAAEAGFAIRAASPNPAGRSLTVTFSLQGTQPARLELLDVHGRRVAARDVSGMGPGLHAVRFDREIGVLPAGVYAIKLTQRDRTAIHKVTIVR